MTHACIHAAPASVVNGEKLKMLIDCFARYRRSEGREKERVGSCM